jgi:hypothetical protein
MVKDNRKEPCDACGELCDINKFGIDSTQTVNGHSRRLCPKCYDKFMAKLQDRNPYLISFDLNSDTFILGKKKRIDE